MKTAFIYSDKFAGFNYGPSHPLKPYRLKLTYELIKAYGLLSIPNAQYIEAEMADEADLFLFHTQEYIGFLKASNEGGSEYGADQFGLGPGDNPVFRGLYDWSRLVTGASLQAARLVDRGEAEIAFNIAGGLHHAAASRASGFCYINDPVIVIKWLLNQGRKVAYIDIDVHHGDGVQEAFYATDKVLTISIHETGRQLFPGTGFVDETGKGAGKGYSVNVPMPAYADDDLFLYAFNEVVPPLIDKYKPDIVVSQLGVDTFRTDPLAHLNCTTNGFCAVLGKIREIAPRWVALGGGGYDIANVAKAWTLAWSIMNDVTLPNELPDDFLAHCSEEGFESGKIRDEAYSLTGPAKERMREEVESSIHFIREKVLPGVR
jgi:acetoin utilization protein AcuC